MLGLECHSGLVSRGNGSHFTTGLKPDVTVNNRPQQRTATANTLT